MDHISHFFLSLSKLFSRKERPKHLRKERLPPSRYTTPLRPQSRVCVNNFASANLSCRRQCSYPENLSKTPKFSEPPPLLRSSSHMCLPKFPSVEDIPFRQKRLLKNRRSQNNSRNAVNKFMDFNCLPQVTNTNATRKASIHEFYNKGSQTSSEFHSATEASLEASAGFCLECDGTWEKHFMKKQPSHLKNIEWSHEPDFVNKGSHGNSKIPTLSLGQSYIHPNVEMSKYSCSQLGQQTFAARRINSKESNASSGETVNNVYKGSPIIGNWIAYRSDTSEKFDSVFKSISKKKHAVGNLIDSTTHSKWIQLAGIAVDKDAFMFRQFAGGKLVLTLGEYKFLIDKICSAHDLDYWDVLRKLATL